MSSRIEQIIEEIEESTVQISRHRQLLTQLPMMQIHFV